MKKLLILTSIFIVGCAPSSTPTTSIAPTDTPTSTPTENPTSTPIINDEKLFISEVYATTDSIFGKAIEIGYLGTDSKCLEGYKLNIYSGTKLTKTIDFTSNDNIDENGTFVIANKTNDGYNYHSKADLILDDDYIYGSNVIELINPQGIMFETFGSPYKFDYASNSSHLKLPEFFGPNTETYNRLHYINVRIDSNSNYLGNLDCPFNTSSEVLKGPSITEEMFDYEFEDGTRPGGGFAEVTVSSYGDGDTTVFSFKESYVNVEKVERTRYMNINTPEISHSDHGTGEEPWGMAAKIYNNDILKGATKILVQSVKGYGFRENYGRLLGYVWYATIENPKLSDYRLLNYELVREAYAYYGESGPLEELYSGEIYYTTYFDYAYLYAQNQKIRIHGEKDPNFDY